MTEIWDIVNRDGEYLGLTWERANHKNIPEGMYHPCVEVWVRVGDRLLIAHRHPDKSEGLKYDAPGGAVVSGESILEGAVRELYEEVGIPTTPEKLEFIGAVGAGRHYAVTYMLRLDRLPELKLQPTEVVGYKLVCREELDAMTDQLCKNCAARYKVYRDRLFN